MNTNSKTIYLPQFTIGEDAFMQLNKEISGYGHNIAIVHGEKAFAAAEKYLIPAISESGLSVVSTILYGHDATFENAEHICNLLRNEPVDAILAVGGGKCIDTVKLAANMLSKPVFTVPTIASNCAPVTKISIMYNGDRSFKEVVKLKGIPSHCFIDPRIILNAPIKYFWAGIGDAIAKFVESHWSSQFDKITDYNNAIGLNAAALCFDPILLNGQKALQDIKNRNVSKELEETILNVIVSPGIVSIAVHPNYNGGIAHALFYGLTCREHIEHNHLHGEVVSYGTLVNLCVDKDYKRLEKVWRFNKAIGLPICLSDLELDKDDPLKDVIDLTLSNTEMTYTPYNVDYQIIRNSILELEEYKA